MPMDLEQTREYVASFRAPAKGKRLVCVDGRTPEEDAGDIARGGAALGMLYDIVDAVEYQGLEGYPGEMVAARVLWGMRELGIPLNYHTDTHAKKHAPTIPDLLRGPIGCKYAFVMRDHSEASRGATRYFQTSDVKEDELEGEHLEGGVVIIDDEEETVPHQVEGGPMIFKWDLARDRNVRRLLVARLEIQGLDLAVVDQMAHRNVVETLAAIESAKNLKMFTVKRYDGELVTELAS